MSTTDRACEQSAAVSTKPSPTIPIKKSMLLHSVSCRALSSNLLLLSRRQIQQVTQTLIHNFANLPSNTKARTLLFSTPPKHTATNASTPAHMACPLRALATTHSLLTDERGKYAGRASELFLLLKALPVVSHRVVQHPLNLLGAHCRLATPLPRAITTNHVQRSY